MSNVSENVSSKTSLYVENRDHTTDPVTLTSTAVAMAVELQANTPDWQGLHLRLYIEGKGCDGFYYGVTFDELKEGDTTFVVASGLDLMVDKDTLPFVLGATVQWVDDERGKGFLVENPSHQAYRGKFYKRKEWQERLLKRQAAAVPAQ